MADRVAIDPTGPFTDDEIDRLNAQGLSPQRLGRLDTIVEMQNRGDGGKRPKWSELGIAFGVSRERARQIYFQLKRLSLRFGDAHPLRTAGMCRAYCHAVLGMIIQVADDVGAQNAKVMGNARDERTRLKLRKKGLPVAARAMINDMCTLPDATLLRLVAAIAGRAEPRILKKVLPLEKPRKPSWQTHAREKYGPPVPAWIRHQMDTARDRATLLRRAAAGFRRRQARVEAFEFDMAKDKEIAAEQAMFATIQPLDWGV